MVTIGIGTIPRLDGYEFDASQQVLAITVAGDFTTEGVYIGSWSGYSIQLTCPATGSPNGTFKLQGCDDEERGMTGVPDDKLLNWFDITGATSPVVGASSITIDHSGAMYRYVRGVYSRSSGSVTATIHIQLKG